MLYNESTGKPKAQADVFSLESLIAWLEKQPADTEYDWYNVHGCLMCAYFKAHGYERPSANPGLNSDTIRNWGEFGYYNIGMAAPWTFGAALDRARKVLAA